jgi:hypothetical protein
MFSLPNGKVTIAQVLLPVSLVAFVMFLSLAFQFTQVKAARDDMHQAMSQQDKPLEEVQKVQNQLNALAIGTKNLADAGDPNAKAIIDRMNKLGITVKSPPASGATAGGGSGDQGSDDAAPTAAPMPAPAPKAAAKAKH